MEVKSNCYESLLSSPLESRNDSRWMSALGEAAVWVVSNETMIDSTARGGIEICHFQSFFREYITAGVKQDRSLFLK